MSLDIEFRDEEWFLFPSLLYMVFVRGGTSRAIQIQDNGDSYGLFRVDGDIDTMTAEVGDHSHQAFAESYATVSDAVRAAEKALPGGTLHFQSHLTWRGVREGLNIIVTIGGGGTVDGFFVTGVVVSPDLGAPALDNHAHVSGMFKTHWEALAAVPRLVNEATTKARCTCGPVEGGPA